MNCVHSLTKKGGHLRAIVLLLTFALLVLYYLAVPFRFQCSHLPFESGSSRTGEQFTCLNPPQQITCKPYSRYSKDDQDVCRTTGLRLALIEHQRIFRELACTQSLGYEAKLDAFGDCYCPAYETVMHQGKCQRLVFYCHDLLGKGSTGRKMIDGVPLSEFNPTTFGGSLQNLIPADFQFECFCRDNYVLDSQTGRCAPIE